MRKGSEFLKKLVVLLLAGLLAVVLCAAPALAAENTFRLEEIDAELTLPEGDFYVLRRGMDPEDPALTDMGLTAEQADELLEAGQTYLDLVYFDGTYELTVHILTGEDYEAIFNYANLSKFERDTALAQGAKELRKQGITVEESDWYETNGLLFFVIKSDIPDSEGWCYQYQTIFNGECIAIAAKSIYTDEPTEEMLEQVKAMADSLRFGHEDQPPQEEEEGSGSILKMALVGGIAGAAVGGGWQLIENMKKRKEENR